MVELFRLGLCAHIFYLLQQNVCARIFLPSFGNLTYVPLGSNVTISWSYDFNEDDVGHVEWRFIKKNGSSPEILAHNLKGSLKKKDSSLPDISFILPSTMILNNVNLSYNGTYRYIVTLLGVNPPSSEVVVIILEQPIATVECSNSPFVRKGENVSCLCNSAKGNPPPTTSWYRNGKLISGSGYLRKKLVLVNVSKKDAGIYKCVVRSHNLIAEKYLTLTVISKQIVFSNCSYKPIKATEGETVACLCSVSANIPHNVSWVKDKDSSVVNGKTNFKNTLLFTKIQRENSGTYWCKVDYLSSSDQTAVNIIVTYKPVINCFTSDVSSVTLGSSIAITCIADGYPQPKYTLFHNRTILLETNEKVMYTINRFSYNIAGEYQCQVTNNLGSTMKRINLKVHEPKIRAGNASKPDVVGCDNCGTKWYIYIITLVGGILLGVVISYVTSLIRQRKENTKEPTHPAEYAVPDSHSEQTRNIPVYQELDLKDMNKEDNYQSLMRNAGNAKNNEVVVEKESGYQELNKVREKSDDNYQSLNEA